MASKRINNANGSQVAILNSIKPDIPAVTVKCASEKEQKLAESIINSIFGSYNERSDYQKSLHNTAIDATLGRIASLLDEVKQSFTSNELESVKQSIIAAVQLTIQNNILNNDIFDIQQLASGIITKINSIQDQVLSELTLQLQELINQPVDTNTDEIISNITNDIENNNSINNEKILDNIETGDNQEDEPTDEINNDDIIKNISEYISSTIQSLEKNIQFAAANISTQINDVSTNIDIMLSKIQQVVFNTSYLKETSKDKKRKKLEAQQKEQNTKNITESAADVNHMAAFSNDIVNKVIDGLADLIDNSTNVLIKFFLKLFGVVIAPTLVILGTALYILAEPLAKILEPIFEFLGKIIDCVYRLGKPIAKFIVFLVKEIFDAIKPILIAFCEGLGTNAYKIGQNLGIFVIEVILVLEQFINGIKSNAAAVAQALVDFAKEIINVLIKFMEGIGSQAYEIGQGLCKFVQSVLDVLTKFINGIGSKAKEIGEALAIVALGILKVVKNIVRFAENCVGAMNAIIGIIADFFEGLKSKAREIGEVLGQIQCDFMRGFGTKARRIGETLAEIALVIVSMLNGIMDKIINIEEMLDKMFGVPWRAFKRWIAGVLYKIGNSSFSIFGKEFKIFEFLISGWSPSKRKQVEKDSKTSLRFIRADEAKKSEEKFKKKREDAAMQQLNEKINNAKVKKLLEKLPMLDKINELIKQIHLHYAGPEKTRELLGAVQATLPQINETNEENTKEINETKESAEEKLHEDIAKIFKKKSDEFKAALQKRGDLLQGTKLSFEKLWQYIQLQQPVILPNNNRTNFLTIEDK